MYSKTLDLDGNRVTLPIWWTRRRDCLSSHVYLYHPNISERFYFHSIEHEDIFFSRHIIVYAPQTKSPTGFSSFPDNASELPNSCSHISRLESTIPTASYTVRASVSKWAGWCPESFQTGRTLTYGASSALPALHWGSNWWSCQGTQDSIHDLSIWFCSSSSELCLLC